MSGGRRLFFIALLAGSAAVGILAENAAVPSPLDAAREDLVELRFERAKATLDALLGRPEIRPELRADALALRAQVLVALGDLGGAAEDWRALLRLRPGFAPDDRVMPSKARARFDAVAKETVGRLLVESDPPEATVVVDGHESARGPDGAVPVVAGERRVRVESPGYDPFEATVEVAPGEDETVSARLVPNARTVVVRTNPEGVAVTVDGVPRGATTRDGGGAPAELVLELLPLGEHEIVLTKPCHRTERFRQTVAVDLIDRSPLVLETRRLEIARTRVVLEGAPRGSEVRVGDEGLGPIPEGGLSLCAGMFDLSVTASGRTIWWERVEVPEGGEIRRTVEPRPNAALVGLEAWPTDMKTFADRTSVVAVLPDVAWTDLESPAEWDEIGLPEGVDFAIARLPAAVPGGPTRRVLWSPVLRRVDALDDGPVSGERPVWSRAWAGWALVDSERAGPAVVVSVSTGGPAAAAGVLPGDRVVSIGRASIGGAAVVRGALEAAPPGRTIEVGLEAPGGQTRTVTLSPSRTPLLPSEALAGARRSVVAAWASIDGAVGGGDGEIARANLAWIFAQQGMAAAARDTWRRVRLPSGSGLGGGTVAYYLGVALEETGDEEGARESYGKAAASDSTFFDHGGPAVAPAARDRLADLGVPWTD